MVYGSDTSCLLCGRRFQTCVTGGYRFCSRACAEHWHAKHEEVRHVLQLVLARDEYQTTPDWQI